MLHLTGDTVTLKPVTPDHGEALRRTLATVEVRARWGDEAGSGKAPAIRCYAAFEFRPVGRMRHYERDSHSGGWHDGLLMDLLADELRVPT